MTTKIARRGSLQIISRDLTGRMLFLLASLMLVVSMFVTFLPAIVFAADEDFGVVSNKTGKPGQDIAINDLQVSGTGDDEISIRLEASDGEMYFDNEDGVTFVDYITSGDSISFYGSRSNVNNVLSTLVYENHRDGTHTIQAVLGDGNYNSENGHVYQVVPAEGISWEDAKEAAEGLTYGGVNGYLATITSQQEHDFIRERISDSGWIGASDSNVEGEWRWVTGPEGELDGGNGLQFWQGDEEGAATAEQYSNWNDGEPNNSVQGEDDGEDCGQIWFEDDSDGQWNDLNCLSDQNEYYVAEFGGSTEETLPDVGSVSFDVVLSRDSVEVSSCDQLFSLGEEHASSNVSLISDIDCQGRTEAPLFNEEDFNGTFEGNGFTIKNLNLENEDNEHVGLTGFSIGATYKNIFLDNISVKGYYHNGVLAGHVDDSMIAENIHATNIRMEGTDVEGYVEQMGVLFGTMDLNHEYQSRIEHVSVEGSFDMSGVGYVSGVGGLVGSMEVEGDLVISQAYADVDIVIRDVGDYSENIGGLIGYIEVDGEDDNADKDVVQGIRDSYSWGSISSPAGEEVGGLIGYLDNDNEDEADVTFDVINSYSWMDIEADNNIGGLIGYVDSMGNEGGVYEHSVNDSFFAGTINGNENAGIIIGNYKDYEEEYSTLYFDNNWYDANKVGEYDCVATLSVDECTGANVDGAQPDYFFNNKTNAPINQWDFDKIWRTQSGTPPVFKPFIGNDSDQDGVNNYIESRAPNNGDANNDGIQDGEQANVASFVNNITKSYVSLALSEECVITDVGILAESDIELKDISYQYQSGLVGFTAECGTEGFTTQAGIYQYGVKDGGLVLRKYLPNTGAYFTVNGSTVSPQFIGDQLAIVAGYSITDGGDLDIDGEANGTIIDPVGLANQSVGSPNTGLVNIKDILFVESNR